MKVWILTYGTGDDTHIPVRDDFKVYASQHTAELAQALRAIEMFGPEYLVVEDLGLSSAPMIAQGPLLEPVAFATRGWVRIAQHDVIEEPPPLAVEARTVSYPREKRSVMDAEEDRRKILEFLLETLLDKGENELYTLGQLAEATGLPEQRAMDAVTVLITWGKMEPVCGYEVSVDFPGKELDRVYFTVAGYLENLTAAIAENKEA